MSAVIDDDAADGKVDRTAFYRSAEGKLGRVILQKREGGRCMRCWHPQTRCICHLLQPLNFEKDVLFMVWMHYKEYLNAGDDAKVLFGAASKNTKLFIFGVQKDDDRLREEVSRGNCIMLFPSEDAITVEDMKSQSISVMPKEAGADQIQDPLRILVLDGTWTMVRKMRVYFLENICAATPQVKLLPRSLEYWTARGNKSVYARTQATPDRICTIEALALLLLELGENEKTCDSLIGYVELNNIALRPEKAQFAKGSAFLERDSIEAIRYECEHLCFTPPAALPLQTAQPLPVETGGRPMPTGKNGKRRARQAQRRAELHQQLVEGQTEAPLTDVIAPTPS